VTALLGHRGLLLSRDSLHSSVWLLVSPQFMPAGTVATDQSPYARASTALGSAVISATQQLFGGRTIELTADGDGFSYPLASGFPSATDFCLEAFVRLSLVNTTRQHIYFSTSTPNPWWARVEPQSPGGNGRHGMASTGYAVASSGSLLAVDTWYHLATTYEAATTTKRLFLDGSNVGSASGASAASSTGVIRIGAPTTGVGSSNGSLRGFIGGLRMTIGSRRYADAGFTPPAEPFPIS
jgi:hypothetical protein